MHISTVNISKVVTDEAYITVAIQYRRLLISSIFRFDLVPFKDQGQGQVHFDCEYFKNGDKLGKHYYCLEI